MEENLIRSPNPINTELYHDHIYGTWTGPNLNMCLWKSQLTISVSDKWVSCHHVMEAFSACGWSGRPPDFKDSWEYWRSRGQQTIGSSSLETGWEPNSSLPFKETSILWNVIEKLELDAFFRLTEEKNCTWGLRLGMWSVSEGQVLSKL
jgi:hypothetical protein